MQKWQYQTLLATTMSTLKPKIIAAGEEGWELVQVIYEVSKYGPEAFPYVAILKRPKS